MECSATALLYGYNHLTWVNSLVFKFSRDGCRVDYDSVIQLTNKLCVSWFFSWLFTQHTSLSHAKFITPSPNNPACLAQVNPFYLLVGFGSSLYMFSPVLNQTQIWSIATFRLLGLSELDGIFVVGIQTKQITLVSSPRSTWLVTNKN